MVPKLKLKILQTIQKHFAILGISSTTSNQCAQDYPFNGRILLGFLSQGCTITLQFTYIFRVADGFMEYIECLCAISGSIITCVSFAAIVFKMPLLFKSIDDIEKLMDSRFKYPESKVFYTKTSQQVEQLNEIVFTLVMKIALQCFILPRCIVSFGIYFFTDSGRDSFQLPFPMWFPFDTNNPIGYLIALIVEYILIGYKFFIAACALGLGVGTFWFAISVNKEFQRFAPIINTKAKANTLEQSNELKILLSELFDAHGIVIQVEHNFSDIFQPILLSVFIWSLLAISGAMLFIQVELLHHENLLPLLLMIISGFVAFIVVFIACELGQQMADAFDEIRSTIEQFDWYLFPIELNRMILIVIAIAQRPVSLECFGSTTSTRELFKKILHCAYSYFMMLRQFGN